MKHFMRDQGCQVKQECRNSEAHIHYEATSHMYEQPYIEQQQHEYKKNDGNYIHLYGELLHILRFPERHITFWMFPLRQRTFVAVVFTCIM